MISFLLDYYFLPVLGHLLAWFDFEKVRDTEYVSDYDPPRVPSKTWRELIKKVGG